METKLNKGDFVVWPGGVAVADLIVSKKNQKNQNVVDSIHYYETLTAKQLICSIIPAVSIQRVISKQEALRIFDEMAEPAESTPSPTSEQVRAKVRKWLIATKTNQKTPKNASAEMDEKPEETVVNVVRHVEKKQKVNYNYLKVSNLSAPININKKAFAILFQLRIQNKKGWEGLHDAKRAADEIGITIERSVFKKVRDEYLQKKTEKRKANRLKYCVPNE